MRAPALLAICSAPPSNNAPACFQTGCERNRGNGALKRKTPDTALSCRIQRYTGALGRREVTVGIRQNCLPVSLSGKGGRASNTVKMRTTKKPLFTGKATIPRGTGAVKQNFSFFLINF